ESGLLYVCDSGDREDKGGAIYRITPQGKVSLLVDGKKSPAIKAPYGLKMDGASHLLVNTHIGELHRIKLTNGTTEQLAKGFDGGEGLAWDYNGQLFVTSWNRTKVYGIPKPGKKPVLVAEGFESATDLCLDRGGKRLLIPDMEAGAIYA